MAETLFGLVLGESTPSSAETLAGVELCQFSSDLVSDQISQLESLILAQNERWRQA